VRKDEHPSNHVKRLRTTSMLQRIPTNELERTAWEAAAAAAALAAKRERGLARFPSTAAAKSPTVAVDAVGAVDATRAEAVAIRLRRSAPNKRERRRQAEARLRLPVRATERVSQIHEAKSGRKAYILFKRCL